MLDKKLIFKPQILKPATAIAWMIPHQDGSMIFRMRDGPKWYAYIRDLYVSDRAESLYEVKVGK